MSGRRRALIIANEHYSNPGLSRLQAPSADAAALRTVLDDPMIGGFEVDVVQDQPAHVIQQRIEDFLSESRPDDALLMHFSGHGLKSDSGDLFFAAANTVPNRLASTAVSADFVRNCMHESRSRAVVLFLDCCYGGAFGRGVRARAAGRVNLGDSFPQGRSRGRGRAVITASSAMEFAFEGDRLATGDARATSVFTTALVEGLSTGAADRDGDGWVSLDELYDFVYEWVIEHNPHQTPSRTIDMQGDFVVARAHGSVPSTAPSSQPLPFRLPSPPPTAPPFPLPSSVPSELPSSLPSSAPFALPSELASTIRPASRPVPDQVRPIANPALPVADQVRPDRSSRPRNAGALLRDTSQPPVALGLLGTGLLLSLLAPLIPFTAFRSDASAPWTARSALDGILDQGIGSFWSVRILSIQIPVFLAVALGLLVARRWTPAVPGLLAAAGLEALIMGIRRLIDAATHANIESRPGTWLLILGGLLLVAGVIALATGTALPARGHRFVFSRETVVLATVFVLAAIALVLTGWERNHVTEFNGPHVLALTVLAAIALTVRLTPMWRSAAVVCCSTVLIARVLFLLIFWTTEGPGNEAATTWLLLSGGPDLVVGAVCLGALLRRPPVILPTE